MRLRKNQPGYRKGKDTIGRTAWIKEVSLAQQLGNQSVNPLGDFQATQNENQIDDQEVIDHLSDVGLSAYRASDMEESFFHSYENQLPAIGNISDVVETSDYTTKPKKAFWLSKGSTDSDGYATTDWIDFTRYEASSLLSVDAKLLACEFKDDAVILEFQEDDDIGKLLDIDCLVWKDKYENGTYEEVDEYEDEHGVWQEDYVEKTITKDMIVDDPFKYCDIDYPKLKEQGVDAIRVQGDIVGRWGSAFYGWDIDSIAILRGDCLQAFHDVEVKK